MRNVTLIALVGLSACLDVEDDNDVVETEAIESHGAAPYCALSGTHWDLAVHEIPVWIKQNAQFFSDGDGTLVSDSQIRMAFNVLFNELQENVPVDVRLVYKGRASNNDAIAGAITIESIPGGSVAFPLDSDQDGDIDRCLIRLGDGPLNSSTTMHEIQHCLGFAHPHQCNRHVPSIMGYSGQGPDNTWNDNAQVYRQYDIEGLHWAYGYRTQYGHGWTIDSTGSTWTELTSTMPFEWTRGPLSSCNNLASGGDQLLFTNLWANKPQRMDVSAGTWGVVPGADSWTAGAIACDGNGGYMAAYIDQNTGTGDATHDAYIVSNGTGTTQNVRTSWNAVSDQLRATRDPASNRYLLVYDAREQSASGSDRPQIEVQVVGGSRVTIVEPVIGGTFPVPSVGTPNIACGPVSVVGAENCLVAWVAGEWVPSLRYVHAHFDPATNRFIYSQANIRTSSLTVWGGPAIAYTGNATTPWLMVSHYGDRYLWAWKKSASLTSSWSFSGIVEGPEGHRFTMPTILTYRTFRCTGTLCGWANSYRVYAKSYRP